MPPSLPDCSIDFTRAYSLPFGVPPDSVVLADLAQYQAELGARIEFLELAWQAADPFISSEHPRDPFTGQLRARFMRNAAAAGVITVPTTLNPAGIAAADMGTLSFSSATLAPVGKDTWSEATPAGGETMSSAMARTFRWDKTNEKILWALPQPYFADETLCLYWPPGAAPLSALGTDIPGIFADDTSSHLLATAAAARDGELQLDLLRSPVRGLARFTRYRHIGFIETGGKLSAPTMRAQSATGAVVLHALPPSTAVPADPGAPLIRDTFLVFEHISIPEAGACIAGLWWLQLLRFTELEAIEQLKKEIRTSTAWAFAVYIALTTIQPPAVDALGGLATATRDKLKQATSKPDLVALRAAISHLLADPGRRSAFANFMRTILAPLACGVSWTELGVAGVPAEPGARSAGNKNAHALLESAQQAKDIWIAVYAGAPVGRPAKRYRIPPLSAPVSDIVRNGFTTFDVEALVLAGRAATVFPAVAPPAAPISPNQPVALAAYAGEVSGRFAALRIADWTPGSMAYTTRDWLRHSIFGWQRTRAAEAPLDFSWMAVAGHPLTRELNWDRRIKARSLRTSLDQVNAAEQAGVGFDQASVAWWSNAVGFSTGTNWPLLQPGGVSDVQDAMREARNAPPSRTGETVGGLITPSGLDEEDLELALEAKEYLRSGHDTTQPVDVALILALLDREGYRMNGRYMRQGPYDFRWRDNMEMVHRAALTASQQNALQKRGANQALGRYFYFLQCYGGDFLDIPNKNQINNTAAPNFLQWTWDNFSSFLSVLVNDSIVANISQSGMNGRMLIRSDSRFDPVSDIGQSRLLSRRIHLAAIIAQHGEFQRRHELLCQGSDAGLLDRWWKPITPPLPGQPNPVGAAVLPDIQEFNGRVAPLGGANAEDTARRDYLAYYALCYLAYNGSPSVWKAWVDRAAGLGAASIPRFLLYEITDAQSAGGGRELWHRGHFVRFVAALDAYLRMSDTGVGDVVFPGRGGWGV